MAGHYTELHRHAPNIELFAETLIARFLVIQDCYFIIRNTNDVFTSKFKEETKMKTMFCSSVELY